MAYDPQGGRLILAGGSAQTGSDSTDAWNGSAWKEIDTTTPAPVGTVIARATDDSAGVIVATECTGDTWAFRGDNWEQLHPARHPPQMTKYGSCAMVYDAAIHRTVLLGVPDAGTPRLAMWLWDGTDWAEQRS